MFIYKITYITYVILCTLYIDLTILTTLIQHNQPNCHYSTNSTPLSKQTVPPFS
jgi:hypothetical protein